MDAGIPVGHRRGPKQRERGFFLWVPASAGKTDCRVRICIYVESPKSAIDMNGRRTLRLRSDQQIFPGQYCAMSERTHYRAVPCD